MKIKVAAVALLLGASSSAALAQSRWGNEIVVGGDLPPRAVMSIVRSIGLSPVSRPTRLGINYVIQAVDEYGDMKRVTVDAESGDVRIRSVMGPGDGGWGRPGRSFLRDFEDDEFGAGPRYGAARPGEMMPDRRWSNVPDESEAGLPARTPPAAPAPPRRDSAPLASRTTPDERPAATKPFAPPAHAKPQQSGPRNAAAHPAAPPSRPAEQPAAASTKPAATEPKTATPRVILPGGPTAKHEQSPAAAAPAVPIAPAAQDQAAATDKRADPGIPPAQTYE